MFERESVVTCPECHAQAEEELHGDAPHVQYECLSCGAVLRPPSGQHCIFCAFGSVPCLPVQRARTAEAEHARPTSR